MIRKLLALASILSVAILSLLVAPAPAGATAPTGGASQLFSLTNQSRSDYGRSRLGWDENLANTAQNYANWMAYTGVFAHDANLYAAASNAVPGLNAWGENIAYQGGGNPIPAMHNNYMGSQGHKDNILSTNYDRVGIGIAQSNTGLTYSVVRFANSLNRSALGQPVGHFDGATSPSVNKLRVRGWGIDPDSTGPVDVEIKINGAVVIAPANVSRPDVGGIYTGYGNNHGFDRTFDIIGGSTKSVCVSVRNLAGYGGTTSLGCKNVFITPDLSGPFYDVSSGHPFMAEISWLEAQGITSGFTDGTFRPNDTVTREAMAAFLWRYSGQPAPAPGAPTFSDVPANHPFATAIRWMAGAGIANGYADGTFKGNRPITRQAASSFLWKLDNTPTVPADAPTFSDVRTNHPFVDSIRWMAVTGITNGYPDGTFHPGEQLSRQAMAAFLHRYDALQVVAPASS